jgi:hypothetical protein
MFRRKDRDQAADTQNGALQAEVDRLLRDAGAVEHVLDGGKLPRT